MNLTLLRAKSPTKALNVTPKAKVASDSEPHEQRVSEGKAAKPYALEIVLVGLTRLSNSLLRGHWKAKHGHASKWKRAVVNAVMLNGGPPDQPLKKAKISIVRVSSVCPDFDGLVSGGKPLIDGLVVAGVIESDKMSCIGQPTYLWERGSRGHGKIKVRVEEVLDV